MDFGTHIPGNESCVDTVRALHQTIVTLRTALERSRSEILELKAKKWPEESVEGTIRNLSIENHVLRQKAVNKQTPTNELARKDQKKKVRRKDSKEKLQVKDVHIEKHDNNIYVSSCSNAPKLSKSVKSTLENKQGVKSQLSKSRIECFSNIFEGDKQISTANNLHTSNKINEKVEKVNLKEKKSDDKKKEKKPAKNLEFSEEPASDIVVSRRGSNSSFVCEEQDVNDLKEFIECVEKSKKLIDSPKLKRHKGDKVKAENAGHSGDKVKAENGSKNKSRIVRQRSKGEETFIKEKPNVLEENLEVHRKSSILGKQIELALKQQYSDVYKEVTAHNEGVEVDLEKENQCDTEKGGVIVDEKENVEESPNDLGLDTLNDDTTETSNNADINEPTEPTEVEIQLNNANLNQVISNDSVLEEEKENIENNSLDKDNSTNSSNTENEIGTVQKNIEISVKIYKGSKKPIEIDIQTKKHKKKNKKKESKMNDKSQNTSFDKEYAETNERQCDVGNMLQNDVDQEVDDIELIFTTDDTKETDFKEELVPIDTYAETQLLQCRLSDYEEKLSAEASDRELEDDVFNDNFENENQENCNFQTQTYDFRRENSQIYNSKSDNSINHEDKSLKSYYSYQDSSFENKSLEKDESFDRFEEKVRIIETDISKIGIQDVEYNLGRRNTCPNPIQYRPIIHREALGRGLNSRKTRPIIAHSNVVRKDSGAQTDISALPGSSWRSESSLGHKVKVGENFTTLPSKFPHPGSRLRLSEKTVEARRVLLSDIGFTSMVPELSRSADHLCPPVRGPVVSSYGQFLRTTDLYSPAYTSQKFVWSTTTPSEGSHSQSRYSSQYPLSSPPAPTRRCSAPVSPSKRTVMKNTPSKVRFANGSLPELRSDWTAIDSGESTDSLVEEAEHFLRRSVDCLPHCRDVCYRSDSVKITGVRRASAPEPSRDNVPPQGWQPFLPRMPRDLHLDYWVKVISPEGRVRGGRVRYVGPLMNQPEPFVGVQLSTPDGHSDGTYNSRRYFNCEPYHGLFVPFKKIIMGWRP